MIPLKNDTLLRALRREPTEHTPVWLMRQAGRYLPEYAATRARAGSFMKLCGDPALATEVTLQPLARFPLDAAILFSDILTVPDAMGLGLAFTEGEGPRFERPLSDQAAISKLAVPDPSRLAYVYDAVASIKAALAGSVPLIGFAGSPFTLACYMIEGAGSADFGKVRRMLYARPDLLHRVLAINAKAVGAYLTQQALHGADVLMIFDTWGGLLAADAYETSRSPISRKSWRTFAIRTVTRRRSFSPRAEDNGWIASPAAVAIAWDWTGPRICEPPDGRSDRVLRYKAISIRWCC